MGVLTCTEGFIRFYADEKVINDDSNTLCGRKIKLRIPARTRVMSFTCLSIAHQKGVLASFGQSVMTDESWNCTRGSDDRDWSNAVAFGNNTLPIESMSRVEGIPDSAEWIWSKNQSQAYIHCRKSLQVNSP